MRSLWVSRHGGPEVLEVRETADPAPQPGEVRIRVKACAASFGDIFARQGIGREGAKPPFVAGYEAAGVIDCVGRGVDAELVGKRVVTIVHRGAQTELLCVAANHAVVIPGEMTFEQAAALPVNYLTASHLLFRSAALRQGESILVHSAAGGVGLAVLQLCRGVEGVETFGTASRQKHPLILGHGCAHAIDYRSGDYADEVRRITGGRGVDVVLDSLGGSDWRKGLGLLKPGGRLVAYGFSNALSGPRRSLARLAMQLAAVPRVSPLTLMTANRAIVGVTLSNLWKEQGLPIAELRHLVDMFAAAKISPVIDSVFPFEKAAQAYLKLERRESAGKVVFAV